MISYEGDPRGFAVWERATPRGQTVNGDDYYTELLSFLKTRQKNSECPRCNENNWAVQEDDCLVGMLPLGGPEDYDPYSTDFHFRMVPVFCQHCGYVELISVVPFESWRAKQGGGDE